MARESSLRPDAEQSSHHEAATLADWEREAAALRAGAPRRSRSTEEHARLHALQFT